MKIDIIITILQITYKSHRKADKIAVAHTKYVTELNPL